MRPFYYNNIPLIFVLLIVTCFASSDNDIVNSDSKLTIQKTTLHGGLLTKVFRTKGLECTIIPVGWNLVHRWAVKVDGNCIALYETKDCTGPNIPVYSKGQEIRGKFSDYIRKIHVNSFEPCEALETKGFRKPILHSTKLDVTFRQNDYGGGKKLPFSNQDFQSSSNQIFETSSNSRFRRPWPKPQFQFPSRTPSAIGGNSFLAFYSQPNYKGKKFYTAINGCRNIPSYLQKQTSSIENRECVRLYTDFNCEGRSIQIQPNDKSKRNLISLDFDDSAYSYSPCEVFQKLGLLLHNYYRALHNSPPLYMVESLNDAAQLMAEYLSTQAQLPKPIGFISAELFYAVNNGPRNKLELVRDAIMSWYQEGEFYDYDNPVSSRFTQLVWRNMTQFGMGTATTIHNNTLRRSTVVANYFPRGNFAGQFKENVLPLVHNAHLIRYKFERGG